MSKKVNKVITNRSKVKKLVNSTSNISTITPYVINDNFDNELLWCIEKLENGLINNNTNNDGNKIEALNILRVLKSEKASMPKKLSLMRSTFNDYHAQVDNDRKKHERDILKSEIRRVESATMSKYLKHSLIKNKDIAREESLFIFDFDSNE